MTTRCHQTSQQSCQEEQWLGIPSCDCCISNIEGCEVLWEFQMVSHISEGRAGKEVSLSVFMDSRKEALKILLWSDLNWPRAQFQLSSLMSNQQRQLSWVSWKRHLKWLRLQRRKIYTNFCLSMFSKPKKRQRGFNNYLILKNCLGNLLRATKKLYNVKQSVYITCRMSLLNGITFLEQLGRGKP